ncbi:MAG: uridine kinase [Candidatus Cloacimonetes bacterium]|nr:uridine kinase [Candidatus Cloacimonadota bacterium]
MPYPVVIGISGGTGSGKTTIADIIMDEIRDNITVITQDSYYSSFTHLTLEERHKINFDHPDAFDIDLLIEHLIKLKKNEAVDMPTFNYITHLREEKTVHKNPAKVIILEGILIFENQRLRELMDIKIFVDTDPDIRILRRIIRDMKERGRTLKSIIDQYYTTVRPMHIEFVEPSKRYADVIIPEGGSNSIAIDMIITKIKNILEKKTEVKQ